MLKHNSLNKYIEDLADFFLFYIATNYFVTINTLYSKNNYVVIMFINKCL